MERARHWGRPPGPDEIDAIARAALARVPETFRRHLDDVVLLVEEWADDETLDALGIDDPLALSGLYAGRPIGTRSVADTAVPPDTIHLYRRALLDEWAEGGEALETLVAHVLIHEIGHHFGLSDTNMAALEAGAD